MAMRNFYVDCSIDGRKTRLTGDPARKDGGMSIKIMQREDGRSVVACSVECEVDPESKDLITTVRNYNGVTIFRYVSKR